MISHSSLHANNPWAFEAEMFHSSDHPPLLLPSSLPLCTRILQNNSMQRMSEDQLNLIFRLQSPSGANSSMLSSLLASASIHAPLSPRHPHTLNLMQLLAQQELIQRELVLLRRHDVSQFENNVHSESWVPQQNIQVPPEVLAASQKYQFHSIFPSHSLIHTTTLSHAQQAAQQVESGHLSKVSTSHASLGDQLSSKRSASMTTLGRVIEETMAVAVEEPPTKKHRKDDDTCHQDDEKLDTKATAANRRSIKQKKKWFDSFQELKLYQEEFGNCIVPRGYSPNPKLARYEAVPGPISDRFALFTMLYLHEH